MKQDKALIAIGVVSIAFLLIGAALLLSGFVTMIVWNLAMPFLFHLPHINLWVAIAINILLGLLKPAISVTTKSK